MKNIAYLLTSITSFLISVIIGGILFSHTPPRFNYQTRQEFHNSYSDDLLGYLTSIGLNNFPENFVPNLIQSSDKSVVIAHPYPEADLHYLIIPKKDLRNLSDLNPDNEEYVLDCLRQAQDIINQKHLTNYQIITNGPGYQNASYLHFHLLTDLSA